jgi:hypothetical protein
MTDSAATTPTIEFRWEGFEPGDPDADEALYRLKQEGGDAIIPPEESPGFVVIPIILGAIAVVALAKAIKSFIEDIKTGTIIDARTEPLKITKDKSLGRGTVLLISKDGSLSLQNPNAEKLGDLIKGAVGGFK